MMLVVSDIFCGKKDESVFSSRLQYISRNVFCLLLPVVFSGFFFLDTATHRVVFYLFLIAGLFCVSWKTVCLPFWKANKRLALVAMAFLFYNFCSVFWSRDLGGETLIHAIKIPIFLVVFSLSFVMVSKCRPNLPALLEYCYVFVAACISCYLLAFYIPDDFSLNEIGKGVRLNGIGRAKNCNELAQYVSFALLITFFGNSFRSLGQACKYPLLLKFALIFLFASTVLLTGGRGAMLALVVAVFLSAVVSRNLYSIILGGLLVFGGVAFVFLTPDVWSNMVIRGDTYRLEIWTQAWNLIKERPLFGYGIGTEFQFSIGAKGLLQSATHNMILGVLIYGGGVGLLLFAALGGGALFSAVKIGWRQKVWLPFSLLVYGLVIMQFSGHTVFLNLNREWWFSWIPLAYIFYYNYQAVVHGIENDATKTG